MSDNIAYEYVKQALEEEFFATYLRFSNQAILLYELDNILERCRPLMEGREEDDRFLRYEVIGTIANYLEEV